MIVGMHTAFVLVALLLSFGDGRTPAEATAHALDELANCVAQHRPECPTATPTPPTATPTPVNTPSPSPTVTLETTSTPTVMPTPEPELCWLTDDQGDVVFAADRAPVSCADPALETDSNPPTPTEAPTPTSAPAAAPVRAVAPVSTPRVEVQTVIQTVVVEVTVAPIDTPLPTLTRTPSPATASSTATSSSTPTPTSTSTPTPTPTATATAQPVAAGVATGEPMAITKPRGRWDWAGFFATLAAIVFAIAAGAWLFSRRKVATW